MMKQDVSEPMTPRFPISALISSGACLAVCISTSAFGGQTPKLTPTIDQHNNEVLAPAPEPDRRKPLALGDTPKPDAKPLDPAGPDKENEPSDSKRIAKRFSDLDKQALAEKRFINSDEGNEGTHLVKQSIHGKRYTLYHLPSGEPAFVVPRHITDRDTIIIQVAVPKGATPSLEVTSCDAVPSFRVQGTFPGMAGAVGLKARQGENALLKDEFDPPHTFPREFTCSGKFVYKLTMTLVTGEQTATTIEIPIDPIYRFAVGVAGGYNFATPTKLALADRNAADGTSTEKFVSQTQDPLGLQVVITIGLHPCGANYANWGVCDVFQPFIGLDPTRPTKGFVAGVNFDFIPEAGVTVGWSIFTSEKLTEGLNVAPGDRWTAAGDVSKRELLDPSRGGLFIGLHANSDLIGKLFPKSDSK